VDDFPGLRATEKVLFVVRKHWVAYLKIFLKLAINLGIIFLLEYFIINRFPHGSLTYLIFNEFLIFYLLGSWWFTFNGWLDEELDTLIITNERLIDTTQSAFISIETSSADLDEIQDVSGKVSGFVGGLFHFGNLTAQTASAQNVFFMDYVKDPERYVDFLIESKTQYLAHKHGQ